MGPPIWRWRIRPSGKKSSKAFDRRLLVGWDCIAILVKHRGSVEVELLQTNGEQLHYFPGIVLVGCANFAPVVIRHVEVVAHGGANGDVVQQGGEVAESVVLQHVHPEGELRGVNIIEMYGFHARNHNDFRERESHSLTKLVLSLHGVDEKLVLQHGQVLTWSSYRIG